MADLTVNYKNTKKSGDGFFTCLLIILFAILFASISFGLLFSKIYIVGNSMAGTFNGAPSSNMPGGDYVYIMKNVEPDYGDIIVINTTYVSSGVTREKILIKRLIAKGNDTLRLESGKLYLNGEYVEESYVLPENNTPDLIKNNFSDVTVPEGYIFCMGDNRNDSVDSRTVYGFIPESSVMGVVSDWSLRNIKAVTAFNTFLEFTLPGKLGIR